MTVLPESPVREILERVEARIVAKRVSPPEIPDPYKYANPDVAWRAGVRRGLALAGGILLHEAPAPGTENTYFEYRVASATWQDDDWCDDLAETQSGLARGLDLFIERRTVTVTQPVRLDDDGEPTS